MTKLRMIALALAMLLGITGASAFGANVAGATASTPHSHVHSHVKHAKTHPTAKHVARRQHHHGSGVAAHRHHARHARHARTHGQRRAQKRSSKTSHHA